MKSFSNTFLIFAHCTPCAAGTMNRNIKSTFAGSNSWDRYDRTPPRGRPDVAARAKFNEELLDMSVILHDLAVDRNTRTGPLKFAGCTPKRVILRQKEAEKKRKLSEINEAFKESPNFVPRKKKLRFEGELPTHVSPMTTDS